MNKWYFILGRFCLLMLLFIDLARASSAITCRNLLFDFHPNHTAKVETPRLLIRFSPQQREYFVYEKKSDVLVGTYQPNLILFETTFQGNGYASEAMIPILHLEFRQNRNADLAVMAINEVSLALFKKLGFVKNKKRDSESWLTLSFHSFEALIDKIDRNYDGDIEAFSKPNIKKKRSTPLIGQLLSAVDKKQIDVVQDRIEKLLGDETMEKTMEKSDFDNEIIYLIENRFKVMDFLSRFSGRFTSPSFEKFKVSMMIEILIHPETRSRALEVLERLPRSTQDSIFRKIQIEYKQLEFRFYRRLLDSIIKAAQLRGLWL